MPYSAYLSFYCPSSREREKQQLEGDQAGKIHTYNHSIWDAGVGGLSQIQGQPRLHSKTLAAAVAATTKQKTTNKVL